MRGSPINLNSTIRSVEVYPMEQDYRPNCYKLWTNIMLQYYSWNLIFLQRKCISLSRISSGSTSFSILIDHIFFKESSFVPLSGMSVSIRSFRIYSHVRFILKNKSNPWRCYAEHFTELISPIQIFLAFKSEEGKFWNIHSGENFALKIKWKLQFLFSFDKVLLFVNRIIWAN